MESDKASDALRILVVDDQEDLATSLAEMIRRELPEAIVEYSASFSEAKTLLRTGDWDLAILDLVDESDGTHKNEGDEVYREVSQEAWTPVIFYTARPAESEHIDHPPLVRTITKTRDRGPLLAAIRDALDSGVPRVARNLSLGIEAQIREFLRDTVLPRSGDFPLGDRAIQAIIQARLAEALRNDLAGTLGPEPLTSADAVDDPAAITFYLYPPVFPQVTTGDVLRSGDEWYLVGTPACDLYNGAGRVAKVRGVRLFRCRAISGHEYLSKSLADRVGTLLRGDAGFFHLPRYLEIPEMLADFEDVEVRDLEAVAYLTRVATVASPFVEKMLSEHGRHVARVGVPDFNRDTLKARLRDQPTA